MYEAGAVLTFLYNQYFYVLLCLNFLKLYIAMDEGPCYSQQNILITL